MKLLLLPLLLPLFIFTSYAQPAMEPLVHLQNEVDSLFRSSSGTFALAFVNLSGKQEQLLVREREKFHAASTMKTPVMIELYRQAAAGKFSLEDSLLVKNEFKSIVDGSTFSLDIGRDDGEHIYAEIGQYRTIRSLIDDMIIYSSNLATNLVIELLDAKKITSSMRALGAQDMEVLRGVEDMKAYDAGLNNSITAYDLMLIYEKLARLQVVSPAASQEIIEILLRQTHRDIIPAKLPQEVKVANKTGFISGLHHDSGIVYLPDGRSYVLVLLSKNMDDVEAGTQMLARVSERVYAYMMQQQH